MGKYSGMDSDKDRYIALHSVRIQKKFAMTGMKSVYGKDIEMAGDGSSNLTAA